jgi:hypothetical protein
MKNSAESPQIQHSREYFSTLEKVLCACIWPMCAGFSRRPYPRRAPQQLAQMLGALIRRSCMDEGE